MIVRPAGTRALLGLLVATVCAPIHVGGQELPLRTGYPGSPVEPCPDWSPPAPPAVAAFQAGTRAARAGRDAEAASHFAVAANAARDWPAAQYNHGVLLSRAGRRREAAERLRRYLTLRPDARDAVAVAERIGQLESNGRPSGPAVLALGLVVPGLGQFYSGRPRMGALVLGLTAGVVASGLLTREVRVRCIDSVEEGRCPSAQIVTREVERPWLDRALAGAAVVAVAGAIEAYFAASGRASRAQRLRRRRWGRAPAGRRGPMEQRRPDGRHGRLDRGGRGTVGRHRRDQGYVSRGLGLRPRPRASGQGARRLARLRGDGHATGRIGAPSEVVYVTNAGVTELDGLTVSVRYPASTSEGWLSAELASSTAPTTITLDADPNPLALGVHRATVVLAADDVDNSPVEIPVTLTVRLLGATTDESGGGA